MGKPMNVLMFYSYAVHCRYRRTDVVIHLSVGGLTVR